MRIKTSNPAIRALDSDKTVASGKTMTIQGTVNKTGLLFLLVVLTATITWRLTMVGNALAGTLLWVGVIGGFIMAMVTIFAKQRVNITAPIYALFEGLFLGAISASFSNSFYKGIIMQAVLLTFAVFFVMLLLYKFRILKASPGFVKGIVIATGGIMVFYLISIVLSFFGMNISVFNMGIIGIVIQLVIVGIAALNLILDFDYIERGTMQGLPKKMEWFGAFGLMVTLVWLYLEILRLLAIFSRN